MADSVIKIDTRQQAGKHEHKHDWFAAHGVKTVRCTLPTGDYSTDGSNVLIDTKRNVDEVAQNINGRAHGRFRRECQRAINEGYRLVVLVENELGYKTVGDVLRWTNGHCTHCRYYRDASCMPQATDGECKKHGTKKPIQGARLYKAMRTMHMRYGVEFAFCAPENAARIICERLGVDYE